jgi:uncharacterized RDD family membrane protein YckC
MQTSNEMLTIQTPEFVGFQYILAGIGTRATAFLLDMAIRGLLIFCLFIVGILLTKLFSTLNPFGVLAGLSKNWILAIMFLAYAIVDLGYFRGNLERSDAGKAASETAGDSRQWAIYRVVGLNRP